MNKYQDYIKMNGVVIYQPDEGLGYDFETTYTEDSTRVQSGVMHATAMFTVEAFRYEATWVPAGRMREILQIIAKGSPFTLHYFSPYYGQWRDDSFYVSKGSLSIGRLEYRQEVFEDLSFNMVGVNPIE